MADEKHKRDDSRGPTRPGPIPGPGSGPGFRPGPGPMAGFMGQKVRPRNAKATIGRMWYYLGKERVQLVISFFLVLAASAAGLVGPYLIGRGIDAMTPSPQGAIAVDFSQLATVAALMAGLFGFASAATWFQNYCMAGVAQRTVRELRNGFFEKLQRLPVRYFDMKSHGDVMSRMANDVENVSNTLTQSITQFFSSIITVVGSLGAMLALNPVLTALSLATIPIGMLITGAIAGRTRNHFLSQQKSLGELNGFIEETISAQKAVKAFRREEQAMHRFDTFNYILRGSAIKAQVYSGLIPPLMNVINNMSFALVAGVGGWMTIKGIISLGLIASFLNYSRQFARPINEIANQFNMLQSAIAGAERVFEVLDEAEEVVDAADAAPLTRVDGSVSLADVSFGYRDDVRVLSNVSIDVQPGETIALVGPTGAGKTTIVNLLTRFYDVDEGSIKLDGRDIRSLKKDELRRSLGMVLQDTYLFEASVKENIRYGRLDATDAEIEHAACLANADGFISRLPKGYDTLLTSEGGNLSQGQRQLLTIARAILANPSILILDEATSSVDTRTEMHIQAAMLELMKGRTSFVIAHRLSTIRGADEILVINGGRIVERGTHEQLMAQLGFYHRLYTSQLRRQLTTPETEYNEDSRAAAGGIFSS